MMGRKKGRGAGPNEPPASAAERAAPFPGETGKEVRQKGKLREYVEAFAIALLIALLVRTFVIQAFKIPSGSMENTLLVGDHIFVNKFLYGYHVPYTKGRVLAFSTPGGRTSSYSSSPRTPARISSSALSPSRETPWRSGRRW